MKKNIAAEIFNKRLIRAKELLKTNPGVYPSLVKLNQEHLVQILKLPVNEFHSIVGMEKGTPKTIMGMNYEISDVSEITVI
jgi:hypothetical protein